MGIGDDTQILIPENRTVSLGLLQISVNGETASRSPEARLIEFIFGRIASQRFLGSKLKPQIESC
jgi:hypothetical protein